MRLSPNRRRRIAGDLPVRKSGPVRRYGFSTLAALIAFCALMAGTAFAKNKVGPMIRKLAIGIIENVGLMLALLFLIGGMTLLRLIGYVKHITSAEISDFVGLAGVVIGAGVVLLGNWINRLNDGVRNKSERDDRREKLKTLIAAELVDVAASLISAEEYFRSAFTALQSSGGAVHLNVFRYSPRELGITEQLGSELLLLDLGALDALTTLRANLVVTRRQMEDSGTREGGAWQTDVAGLLASLRHSIGVLGEALKHIAPTRQLQLPGHSPERASVLLRRIAHT